MNITLKQESTLRVLALCVLTVGAYLMYKLYEFSTSKDMETEGITKPFMMITIALFCVSLVSLLWGVIHLPDTQILRAHLPIHAVSSIFDVIWIMKVRTRLNHLFSTKKGQHIRLNPFLTSVLHVVYFQYMINKYSEGK